MIASIRDLCKSDHGDAPDCLAGWLKNKTPQDVAGWIRNPMNTIYLAEIDGMPAAVGGIRSDGEIILNYVDPAFRFRGVSNMLLDHMESALADGGLKEARLISTGTARPFYLARNWIATGETTDTYGVASYPMVKRLVTDSA